MRVCVSLLDSFPVLPPREGRHLVTGKCQKLHLWGLGEGVGRVTGFPRSPDLPARQEKHCLIY